AVYGQTEVIVYDGYTGIVNPYLVNDTARITILLPESPAFKAGLRSLDQIIAIDDSVIAGRGIGPRTIEDLLYGSAGTPIQLLVKRRAEDSLMHFSFNRELYMHQIEAYEFRYLVDSLEQWDINDILSGSLDSLFKNPLEAKSRVYSVEEGSPAAKIGILAGDQVISLLETLDKEYYYHISGGITSQVTTDTAFTILRGDSLIYFDFEPSVNGSFSGLESQFSHDFSYPCAWLRVKTVNRISEDRNYLVNLPEMGGTDSANFYLLHPSGRIEEKRSGILVPVEERDFIYKGWHVANLPLLKDAEQTFYVRWKAESSIGAPLMHLIAQDTIIKHDRAERMVLFALLGMMLIISVFFLIFFFAILDRQYLYFSLYILFFAAFLFVAEGYLGEYQWKEKVFHSVFISSAQTFVLSLLTICFLLFGISYLELRKNLRGWYWTVVVLLGLIGLRVLFLLLSSVLNFEIGGVFEDVLVYTWALSVAIIPLFLLIIPAILRIRARFKPAWYFLIANLVLVPLTIITLLAITFSFTAFTVHESVLVRILEVSGVYIAAVLQILIFSIGIGEKMRLDEKERKRAQLRIIDQLKENEKLKDKVNRELEQKVQERTREISEQKEEIESQRDEIEAQRDLLFAQKKEMTDSIGYAQRIQAAILPQKSYLDSVIPEYFVLFKPRDIVSGDFYWIKEIDSSIVIVAADCTGHGVPGAFMSMLGITLLNELFVEGKTSRPGDIMEQLRTKVKAMLVQEGTIRDQKDGMDMAIAVINKEKRHLQFAGAYNPLYLIRDKEQLTGKESGSDTAVKRNGSLLFELKGDKQPIGIHWEETEFRNQVVELKENDSIYVFSDGYVDQYGGEHRKKFKTHKFKDLLLSVHSESMEKQRQIIDNTFEEWRGSNEQIDDVCVIGIRI
ncbi:MAG: SpoIIE family protein phosphatase, partial [Bacteroidota bacterium]|nr:SpoIIE family protein phosphatase [Bacteroidota bacterium]